ncbi:MAG: hypothetical protein LBB91_01560 [Clostridiales bacterium]|jgi:hypothetical protein|nr:hypothetical protein [Clostridiales bacterium]
MKKTLTIALLALLVIFILTACSKTPEEPTNKTPEIPAPDQFRQKAEAAGYIVEEYPSDLLDRQESDPRVYLDFSKEYDMEFSGYFAVFDTAEFASQFYAKEKEIFENMAAEIDLDPLEEEQDLTHYTRHFPDFQFYVAISCRENTVIGAEAGPQGQEELIQFFKDLGYLPR